MLVTFLPSSNVAATNPGKWSDTIAMVGHDQIYTIEKSGALYRTDPTNGKRVQVGKPDFVDTEFFFADLEYLYTIETDGNLYRVSSKDGSWVRVGQEGDWKDTIALVRHNYNTLFTIEKSGALYRTDLTSGEWVKIGKPDFANTRFMFKADVYLFTVEEDGSLYRVHMGNGTWRQVGRAGDWKDTIVATSYFNLEMYTVETNGALYKTDMFTGTWKQLGNTEFGKAKFMCGHADSLYTIEDGDLYRIDRKTGARRAVG